MHRLVQPESLPRPGTVIFFDGVCGLCNRFVDYLVRHDRAGRLMFAPVQGATFAALAERHPELRGVDSMVFLTIDHAGREKLVCYSEASIGALRVVGGWNEWGAGLLQAVPKPLRQMGYQLVARVRYRVFGRRTTCRLPSAEERERFLP